MSDFVHLHNHSDYSLLDGAASIDRLVSKAHGLGMKHLALTDHGNMFGTLKFYKECTRVGINPIVGCEFYVAPHSRLIKTGSEAGNKYYHLVLAAKDAQGYRNLMRLSSAGYTEGFYYKPRIDDELLQKHSGGLLALSGCLAGEIPTLLLADRVEEAAAKAGFYSELFGRGDFYLEVQDHGIAEQRIVNRAVLKLAARLDLPVVATNDVHYVDAADAVAQDVLICIGTGKKKSEGARLKFESDQFYLKTQEEMARLFSEVPAALRNSLAAAERCRLSIDLPGPLLPDYEIPSGFSTPDEYLRHLAVEGLRRRYAQPTAELKQRLDYELSVIISMKFTGYFLIVWDFINYAKEHGIPVGPGRGSGAGSIVAYCLRITDIDPMRYGLLFERFLNPERVSMPDFDIDFCFERRQEVIDYVTRKYGTERVGQIITFGTLKAKAVIKDVARVLDISFAKANEIAKLIPDGPKVRLKDALENDQELSGLAAEDELYAELIDISRKLEGLSRHASTHPAGIVIGKTRLTDYVPLYRDPKTGSIVTQYTMDQLEACGLVKMDCLGLKTLTLIKNTEDLIRKHSPDFDIEAISDRDERTFALLGEGRSACIFQFESQGMQNVLRQAKPSSLEELFALNALYRPGPMDNISQFIDAKWGRKPIRYPLPELEAVLKETYGVIVYQEQVMEIARIVAGYSLGQADILRRAMGKKMPAEMAKQKANFLKGAAARGLPEKTADKIFELLVPFGDYGFNKSHAAAYSVLAYKTAYLKAHYPSEFMAANLTNEIGNPDKLAEYIAETRGMGIPILPPDINMSEKWFAVVDGSILYGLLGIKNMGSAAAEAIVHARATAPFKDLPDFLDRVDLKTVNRKVLETGIQCGLFDSFGHTRASLINNLDVMLGFADSKKAAARFGQASLFDSFQEEEFHAPAVQPYAEYPKLELLRIEKEMLGFFFSGHPLDDYRAAWERSVTLDLSKPERFRTDRSVHLLGIVRGLRVILTKKSAKMAFATLEDYRGAIELVIFTPLYEAHRDKLVEDSVLAVSGRIDLSREEPKFIVEEIKDPAAMEAKEAVEVHLRLAAESLNEDDLYHLRSYLFEHSGTCDLYLHIPDGSEGTEHIVKASTQMKISARDDFLASLRSFPNVLDVWKI